MAPFRSGMMVALTAAGLVATAGLCSCASARSARATGAGHAGAGGAGGADASLDGADDLRNYLDHTDAITEMDKSAEGDPKSILEAPPDLGSGTPDGPPSRFAGAQSKTPTPVKSEAKANDSVTGSGTGVEPAGPPSPNQTPEAPEAKLAKQIAELRDTIRSLRTGGDGASAEAMELLALGLLNDTGADPDLDAVKGKLSAGQRRSLGALQDLLEQVRDGDGAVAPLDARRLSRLLTEYGEKLADQRPLKISATALCTSVQSFGSYTKFPDYTFLQGRAQPVIVYVALENFAQRPAGSAGARTDDALAGATFNPPSAKEREKKKKSPKEPREAPPAPPAGGAGGDLVVELTESIAIYDDSDDIVVWKAPEASIRDVARDRRKDYYLVQRIELPARLTLGRYNVKISVHDLATGATDDAVIPIDVVADPSLISAK